LCEALLPGSIRRVFAYRAVGRQAVDRVPERHERAELRDDRFTKIVFQGQPDRRVLTRSANGCLRHELIGVASKLRSRSGHKRSILVPERSKVQNGSLYFGENDGCGFQAPAKNPPVLSESEHHESAQKPSDNLPTWNDV